MREIFSKIEPEDQYAALTSTEPQMCLQLNPDIPDPILAQVIQGLYVFRQEHDGREINGVLAGIDKDVPFTEKQQQYYDTFWDAGIERIAIDFVKEPVEGIVLDPALPDNYLEDFRKTFDIAQVQIDGQERDVIRVFYHDVTS